MDRINDLIKRAAIIRDLYYNSLGPLLVSSMEDINKIEGDLDVQISSEFISINSHASYENLSVDGKFAFSSFPRGVISYTLKYRKEGLPKRYIVFDDDGDAGFVLMETQDSPDKPSPVIWCDYEDMFNLCAGEGFKYNPDIWPSFTDFFEYLVTEEEKRAAEEE
jgi:hypothetical protein